MTMPLHVNVKNQFLSYHTERNEITTQCTGYIHYATIQVHINLT